MNNTFEKLNFLNRRKKIGTLCCAPFTSMYFGHKGIVSVCCSNRTTIMGIYPEKTLKEIWEGEVYATMRKEHEDFKFSRGCEQCKRLLSSGNFKSLKIPQHDIPGNDYKSLKYPYKLNFELDNKCNLMCIMCHGKFSSKILKYREKKPEYISPYLTDRFFDELKPFLDNAGLLEFYGGEPFLIDIYIKILDYVIIHNPNVRVYIQSNGTVISKKILSYFDKLNINLSLSIDSVNKEVYDKVRVGADFNQVEKNVSIFSELLKKCGGEFYISPVLFKLNYLELINFYNFSNKYNMKMYFHDLTTPRELSVYSLDYSTLKTGIDNLNYKLNKIIPLTEIEKYNYNVVIDQIKHLSFILNNVLTVRKDTSFSLAKFLKVNYPDLHKHYMDKIQKEQIDDRVLSNSIAYSSMNEPPESFLFKKIENHKNKDIEKILHEFIEKEKFILSRM